MVNKEAMSKKQNVFTGRAGGGKTQIRRITFCRSASDGFGAEGGDGVRAIVFVEIDRAVQVEG